MRKVLPQGAMQVRDLDRDIVTGYLFVEDTSDSDQVQRWFLLGGDQGYRPPPTARIQVERAVGTPWETTALASWLDAVRSSWREGSKFIAAYFRSYSSDQLPELPANPLVTPGFWYGDRALPAGVLATPNGGYIRGQLCQFDVGTSRLTSAAVVPSWMYRFDPPDANPSFEYFVLNRAHDPARLPLSASGSTQRATTVADFVALLNEEGIWREVADTVALGACFQSLRSEEVR